MKTHQLFAGAALLALVVSCNNTAVIKGPGVPVSLDEKSTVQTEQAFGLDNKTVKISPKGQYYAVREGDKIIERDLVINKQTNVDGKIIITRDGLPQAALPEEGGSENSGIVISVDNPSPEPIIFKGVAIIDGTAVNLPEAEIPAGGLTEIGYFESDRDVPVEEEVGDIFYLPASSGASKAFECGIEEVEIGDIDFSPKAGTKSVTTSAASTYKFKVSAKYVTLLSYKKGTVVKITTDLDNLHIKLDRVTYPLKAYDINTTFENPLSFDISFTGKSEEGIKVTSDKAIAAGTVESPAKTDVVLHVEDNSGKQVSEVVKAKIELKLTAAKNGASFPKGSQIGVYADKLIMRVVD